MIQLKSSREIELMSQGGKILGETIRKLAEEVRPGMSTADLDAVAEAFIRSHDGAKPAGTADGDHARVRLQRRRESDVRRGAPNLRDAQ